MNTRTAPSKYLEPRPMLSHSTLTAMALLAMMTFSAVMSFLFFSKQSLRLDEAQSLWQTTRSVAGIFNLVAEDVHVPLYHVLLHFWRIFFGSGVETARMLSLLLYLANIPALYFLGKQAYGRSVGLCAALLFSVSPFMNWYGNEIRMYTLFTLMTTLNQYFFIRTYKTRDVEPWFGYALTAFLGIFTHYFFFLNLIAQIVFYFIERKVFPKGSFRRFLTVAIVLLISFAPWVLYVYHLGEAGNQTPLLVAPSTVNLFGVFSQFFFGFQNDNINTMLVSLWPISIFIGFLALRRRSQPKIESEYFLLTVLLGIGIAFLVSFIRPLFVSRYLVFTLPSLYLLLSSVFMLYPPRTVFRIAGVLMVIMLGAMALEIVSPTTPVKEDYRDAVNVLNTYVKPQDTVVVSAPFTIYPIEYYYHGPAPLETIPVWDRYSTGGIPAFNEAELPNDVKTIAADHQRLWLVLSYDQGYEKKIKDYFDSHYKRLLVKQFSPDLNLYVYQTRYDTPNIQAAFALQLKTLEN